MRVQVITNATKNINKKRNSIKNYDMTKKIVIYLTTDSVQKKNRN